MYLILIILSCFCLQFGIFKKVFKLVLYDIFKLICDFIEFQSILFNKENSKV